jgi:hypothetical protein
MLAGLDDESGKAFLQEFGWSGGHRVCSDFGRDRRREYRLSRIGFRPHRLAFRERYRQPCPDQSDWTLSKKAPTETSLSLE